MTDRIVHYHPPSKTFLSRERGGQFVPRGSGGVVVTGKPGVVQNTPQSPPGPRILKQTKGV